MLKRISLFASMTVLAMAMASPAMAETQSVAALAENAPTPPPFEVKPNGNVVIDGDVVIVDGCEHIFVSGSDNFPSLTDRQFKEAAAQCEALGSSTTVGDQYADDATNGTLPDTGGPALLMPVAALAAVIGLGGLLLGRRPS